MLSELIDQQILSNNNNKFQSLQVHIRQPQQQQTNQKSNTTENQVFNTHIPSYTQNLQQPLFIQRSSSKLSQSTPGNHTCSQCNKTFYKNAHLVRHISQKHSGIRSFVCPQPECAKTFKRDSHLRRHMISHTHQKRFKCSQCIMAFGYKHHLDRHIKTVHQKQLLRCEQCGQSFAKKKPFLKHVQKNHSKNTKNKNLPEEDDDESDPNICAHKNQNSPKDNNRKKIKKAGKLKQKNIKLGKRRSNDQKIGQGLEMSEEDELNSDRAQNDCEVGKREKKVKDKEGLLFRCVYVECVSAFERMHQLMRHLKYSHKENSINSQQN